MANQTSHTNNVASMNRAELMALVFTLEAQNRTLRRRIDQMQQQANNLPNGTYIVDCEGRWNGPIHGDTDELLGEHPDGCAVVELLQQYEGHDEEECPEAFVANGCYARTRFSHALSW